MPVESRPRGKGKFPIPVERGDSREWGSLAEETRNTRYSPGKKLYIRYLEGERLTIGEAVKAMCHVCHGRDLGTLDCEGRTCPLYPWHPNRKD